MSKVWPGAAGSTRWISPFRNLIAPGWPGPFKMAHPLPAVPALQLLWSPSVADRPAFWAPLPPAKAPDASTIPRLADTAIPPRITLRTCAPFDGRRWVRAVQLVRGHFPTNRTHPLVDSQKQSGLFCERALLRCGVSHRLLSAVREQ